MVKRTLSQKALVKPREVATANGGKKIESTICNKDIIKKILF